jgi:hypothetical protein
VTDPYELFVLSKYNFVLLSRRTLPRATELPSYLSLHAPPCDYPCTGSFASVTLSSIRLIFSISTFLRSPSRNRATRAQENISHSMGFLCTRKCTYQHVHLVLNAILTQALCRWHRPSSVPYLQVLRETFANIRKRRLLRHFTEFGELNGITV